MKGKLFILIVCLLLPVPACSTEKSSPKVTFEDYTGAWRNSNFVYMYQLLSEDSRASVEEKDFVQRYTSIYKGIEAANINVQADYPKTLKPGEDGVVTIPYRVSMDTAAGQIAFSAEVRLKQEQVDERKEWKVVWDTGMIFPEMESDDKVRISIIPGRRGEILDRNNRQLAMNGTIAEVGIVPGKLGNGAEASKAKIGKILGVSVEAIDRKLSASYVKPDMFIPIRTISEDEREKKDSLLTIPGVMINSKKARVYPLKEKAAHLTGYIQAVYGEELEKLAAEGYTKDDVIGRSGLEKIYENTLRSRNGAEIYIIDREGKKKRTLALKEAEDGRDLKLTIDMDIQSALFDQLGADAAAGAAMHPITGEVLALVSTPAYDPNRFVLGLSDSEWKGLNENPGKPLSNRFAGSFCPGSVFKPVTAVIALKTNRLDMEAPKNIKGLNWQKDKSWGNYYVTRVSEYPEPANLQNALVHSDNIYFAQAALDIGSGEFLSESKNFGLGEKIPFEYGLARSQFDADGVVKSEIQLADSGYGQGEILINPLHIASIYSAFANEGNMVMPYLEYKNDIQPKVWKEEVFSPHIAAAILNCLVQAVENPVGTGHQAYLKEHVIAGKTGTAEIKRNKDDDRGTELGWFAAFNADDPRLLVVAMVEDVKNRGGSHYVVPKIGKLLKQFL